MATRYKMALRGREYCEMYSYNNATAEVIDTANTYHAVFQGIGNNDGTLAPQQDSTFFTYKAGVNYSITHFTDYSGTVAGTTKVTTSATHALLVNEPITITGTTNYNGAYIVTGVIDGTNFYITKAFVADDATGSARRPATIKVLQDGIYRLAFNISGVAETNNDVFKWEMNKDITPLDNISARAVWTSGSNYRSNSATGFCSLTANQYLWLSVKNYSGTGDLTMNNINININRI